MEKFIPVTFKVKDLYALKEGLQDSINRYKKELEKIDPNDITSIWVLEGYITHNAKLIEQLNNVIDRENCNLKKDAYDNIEAFTLKVSDQPDGRKFYLEY